MSRQDLIATIPLPEHKRVSARSRKPRCLLVGPYDPKCGEYTFLAPPLGVWRLVGNMRKSGIEARVFDPNNCEGVPEQELRDELQRFRPDIVGISSTGMTLNHDLALAHIVRDVFPNTLIVAGGMEPTFNPDLLFRLGPFDIVVLGEGERPLNELIDRWQRGETLLGIPGTAIVAPNGDVKRHHGPALDAEALRASIMNIPYEDMPYESYWQRLESAYAVGNLPQKAAREARLAEIRSVRLITLNYCPMGCTFCSSTNFLHEAEGRVAKVARLSVDDCVALIDRILGTHPRVRTIIFQDDIFVFTNDDRIEPLCKAILARKTDGRWPSNLRFISTNRIDAMSERRLMLMYEAGFRVLGFGIESFSETILREFNKRLIFKHIGPKLKMALRLGITPFLDLIMSSPRCSVADIATNVRHAFFWLNQGCEVGMYPFVIPFSGSAMAKDKSLAEHIEWEQKHVDGTAVRWQRPARILPIDPEVRRLMLAIESTALAEIEARSSRHLPSRVRSLMWIDAARIHLRDAGWTMPESRLLRRRIDTYLTRGQSSFRQEASGQ